MPPVIGNGVSGLFAGRRVDMRTEDLGMLGEGRGFARERKRMITGLRGPLCLRLRSRLLARGKAGEEGRSAGHP